MTHQSLIHRFCLGLTVLISLLATNLSAASPAHQEGTRSLHVTSPSSLHRAVVAHSVRVAEARQDVSRVLDDPAVRAQVKKFGVEPQQLQKRVALLTESEVLELQSQIMPLAEQLEAAAQEGNRKKALIWVLVGVVAALTIAMFLYYS